ncbi:MAG: hypothetical protein MR844_01365 [Clostridia bacterium]|nr:hypothetical protein [Clostridia bacterium]
MKKKILSAIIAGVLTLGCVAPLAACGKNDDKSAYISVDINPSVELIVGSDGKVTGVRGTNEDGLVLLYNESGIEGETVKNAVAKIVNLAVEQGYLNEDNKVVNTTVAATTDKKTEKLEKEVDKVITATADKSGLKVKIDTDGAYSVQRRFEEFKKAHPSKVVQALTLPRFRLALSVSETGAVSLETAVEMDNEELIAVLKEYDEKIEQFATDAYILAKRQAEAAYDKAVTLYTYSEYSQFYAKNLTAHHKTAYLGGMYQTYASAALMMDSVKKVAEYANRAANYPLTEEQIAAVVKALQLENADPIKDRDGNVTIKSIEAYADKEFKNSEVNAELQAKKQALTEALNKTEAEIKEKINAFCVEYKEQIEYIVDLAQSSYNAFVAILPADVKASIKETLDETKETIEEIKKWAEDEKAYFTDLDTFTARLESQADKYLGKIKEDLSEEEWNAVQKSIEADIANAKVAKDNYNDALAKAEAEAKKYLDSLKGKRKQEQAA